MARRGLQPRPVARPARDHRRGLPPLPPRRRQRPVHRHLLVDAPRARGRPLRFRMARRPHGQTRQVRSEGRPGHPLGLQARVDVEEVPRDPALLARPDAGPPRQPAQPLLHFSRVSPQGGGDEHAPGRALQGPPGPRPLARVQRVRRGMPLPPLPGGLPLMAQEALRRPRRPQRGLVDGFLEPSLYGLGAGGIALSEGRRLAARPGPRLEALRRRPVPRFLPGGIGPAARDHPRRAGRSQHDGSLYRAQLLELGAARRRDLLGLLSPLASTGYERRRYRLARSLHSRPLP